MEAFSKASSSSSFIKKPRVAVVLAFNEALENRSGLLLTVADGCWMAKNGCFNMAEKSDKIISSLDGRQLMIRLTMKTKIFAVEAVQKRTFRSKIR